MFPEAAGAVSPAPLKASTIPPSATPSPPMNAAVPPTEFGDLTKPACTETLPLEEMPIGPASATPPVVCNAIMPLLSVLRSEESTTSPEVSPAGDSTRIVPLVSPVLSPLETITLPAVVPEPERTETSPPMPPRPAEPITPLGVLEPSTSAASIEREPP